MEKKPRSRGFSCPGPKTGFKLVGQGVLPVQVADDDGGPPPAGDPMQKPHEAQQRFQRRERGCRNASVSREVFEQFKGGWPSIWVISRLNAGCSPRACGNVVAGPRHA